MSRINISSGGKVVSEFFFGQEPFFGLLYYFKLSLKAAILKKKKLGMPEMTLPAKMIQF